jgi:hypothetical protein
MLIINGNVTLTNSGTSYGCSTSNTTISTYAQCGYSNGYVTYTSHGVIDDNMVKMVEYIDYMSEILGIDIDFGRFTSMSDDEKKQFLRNEKLKKIL